MGRVIAIIGGVVAVFIILALVLIFIFKWGLLEFAELGVILMAAFSCLGSIIGIALLAVLLIIALTLRDNVVPLLENATDTARTVKGTAVFVSEGVATPIIKVAGAAAGLRALLQTALRRGEKSPTTPEANNK